ncbi:MAG TPA: EAL domain-containing protein, partial [Streptosporangiaceae bacterium]|nr:EAL domain-containing protein [Streptosporangiaceae bacterium]
VVSFNPDLDQHSRRQLALLGELRAAIERAQLVVHYQPKAELATGRILGVEALVRWQHPDHGLLQPGEFMPQVERTELIRPLTRYVLHVALEQARSWLTEGHDLSLAVNIGARNLLDATFPEEVAALLADTGVPADHLVLEITESTIMADPTRSEEVLTRLCLLGVKLAIDDFGTGFSSMAHLRDLTIHELKIDRSFISHMCHRPNDAVIVRSTIALARSLGLHVVAEGVEDQQTWDELERLRCHAAQGYFLSRPLPADELARMLPARPIVSGPH